MALLLQLYFFIPMLSKPPHCSSCILSDLGTGFSLPSGTGKNGVLLIGEALGKDEAVAGSPFVGAAGYTLNKILKKGGMERDDFKIYNTIQCQPPFNKLAGAWYANEAINHCSSYLDKLISDFKPRCIVALGNISAHNLIPNLPVGILQARGYTFWSDKYQTWVVATIHPSFIMRGQTAYAGVLIHDLQHSIDVANNGYSYSSPSYLLDPTPSEALRWVEEFETYYDNNRDLFLSTDIETPRKDSDEQDLDLEDGADYTILRCGYSYRDLHAMSIPWDGPYRFIHERLLRHLCRKLFWNGSYDRPRIQSQGIAISGPIEDGMDAFHILQSDWRKGLGFVTPLFCPDQRMWKHLSKENPALYNAIDADTAGRNMRGTIKLLKQNGLFKIYQEFIVELDPVFDSMTKAGMPIDKARRIESSIQLTQKHKEVRESIESIIPAEIKNLSPKSGYVHPPTDTTGMVEVVFGGITYTYCSGCGERSPKKTHFKSKPKSTCSICGKKWTVKHHSRSNNVCFDAEPVIVESNPCVGQSTFTQIEGEKRWAKVEPFLASNVGIKRYQTHYKHQFMYEGYGVDKKYTANEKAIDKLIIKYSKDEFYPLVLEDREYTKLGGTYIGWFNPETGEIEGGFPVWRDGRVHGHFTHNPSTLRSSMVNPSLQVLPRGDDSEVQRWVKQMFVAPEGFIFTARDFKGIEAVLVGREAGDREYIRLARIDVHSYYTAFVLNRLGILPTSDLPDLKWSDKDLIGYLSAFKKRFGNERNQGKVCIHAGNYHIGAKELQSHYPKWFKIVKDAAIALALYYDVFPLIPKWHERICLQVDKTSIIYNSFGHAHRFHDVLKWEKHGSEWSWDYSNDSKRLIAFGPQSDASLIGKRALKRCYYNYPDSMARWLRLFNHDEIFTETPIKRADEADSILEFEMGQPIPELTMDPTWGFGTALAIDTEGKRGPDWYNMH